MTVGPFRAGVVLLAAGLSRRMGDRNKLLIELDGQPLVRRTAKAYLAAGAQVHVVLGHEADKVRAVLADLPLSFAENPDFAEGQPASVRAGLDSLTGSYDAILVALADQAALMPADISDLIRAFAESERDRIFVPYFQGARGNPVVFPPALIASVRASGRNATLRSFIDSNPDLTQRYEASNDHFVIDIDTPGDLAAFETAPRPDTA